MGITYRFVLNRLISGRICDKRCFSVVIRAKNRFLWTKYALPPFSGHPYLTDKALSPEDAVVKNLTGRAVASTEGLALAYFSLFMMAIVPIIWGSFRSITYHRKSKVGLPSSRLCKGGLEHASFV
eukprot:sb/3475662/